MKVEFEALFGRRVDVITRAAVEKSPNWIRRGTTLSTPQTIYAPG